MHEEKKSAIERGGLRTQSLVSNLIWYYHYTYI